MKKIILLAIFLFAINPFVLAQNGENLMELVSKFQKLLKEANNKGRDTSRALELDKKSREAMDSGNSEEAARFLKEAITTIESNGTGDLSRHFGDADNSQRNGNNLRRDGGGIKDIIAEYQSLLKEAKSSGRDVAKALSLNEQSMIAAKSGNLSDSEKFLKEAIISLKYFNGKQYGNEAAISRATNSSKEALAMHDSPFGIHEARFGNPDEISAIKDIGASSARLSPQGSFVWDIIERERGKYDWSASDKTIGAGYASGIKILVNVLPFNRIDRSDVGPGKSGIMLPKDMDWYLEFLRNAAERYDGDGIDDAPGSPRIDVIQIANEIDMSLFWKDTPERYALLLKRSYQTIKMAAPDMKVAIAGVAVPSGFQRVYKPILKELNNLKDKPGDQYFEIFDFHWAGHFDGDNGYAVIEQSDGSRFTLKGYISSIRHELEKIGYKEISFYITEMSDYSDSPAGMGGLSFSRHTERQHAASLIKRFIYSLAAGVNKVYWAQIIEQHNFAGQSNGYFDNVGLINNPKNPDGLSHKKLAYYSYKKLVEVLDGSDWRSIQTVSENDGVYVYRLLKSGKPVWVAWNDNDGIRTATINSASVKVTRAVPNFDSGKEVAKYNDAFDVEMLSAPAVIRTVKITLDDSPVLIEER